MTLATICMKLKCHCECYSDAVGPKHIGLWGTFVVLVVGSAYRAEAHWGEVETQAPRSRVWVVEDAVDELLHRPAWHISTFGRPYLVILQAATKPTNSMQVHCTKAMRSVDPSML